MSATKQTWAGWLGCLILTTSTLAATAAQAAELIDGIAAQVGSDIVLVSEVKRLSAPMEEQMREAGAPEQEIMNLQADLLERLIERRLVEQVVRRTELQATDAEVEQAVAGIAAENGLTMDQLRESVEAHGLSFESYQEKIRGEIQRSKILAGMVRSRVRVEESELQALYTKRFADQPRGGEEVHLRHLFVSVGGPDKRTERDACKIAETARRRFAGGEPFAELAAQYSEANPQYGGDVGWVHASSMAAWMSDVVKGLEPGEVSDVVQMPFGCNLLYLEARRNFEPMTFEQAQPMLFNELYEQKMEQEYESWIETLRTQTYIERKGVFADAGSRLGDLPPVGGPGEAPAGGFGLP